MTYHLKPIMLSFVVLFLCIFALTAVGILMDGFTDNVHKSDVAIILGSKVNSDGTLSPRLAARLDKGLELYQYGLVNNFIVSGGIGKEGIDEAVAMKNYLLAHHIPPAVIFTDSQGNNTAATARNSALIMHDNGFKSAVVVSQYFHLTRARLALKNCKISPVYSAHANFAEWRDFYSTIREVIGFYAYLLIYRNC